MNKKTFKRIVSLLISVVMLMTMASSLVFAAEYDIDIVLSKESALTFNGMETMKVTHIVNPGSLNLQNGQVVLIKLSEKLTFIVNNKGTAVDAAAAYVAKAGDKRADSTGRLAYSAYVDDSDFLNPIEIRGDVTLYNDGSGVCVSMNPMITNQAKLTGQAFELMSVLVGIKSGYTWDDITADDIRLGTPAEAAAMENSAVASIEDGAKVYYYQHRDGRADEIPAPSIITSGFEFAGTAPAITKIEKPAADATEFVYDGTAKTYTIAANDAYTVTGATQTNAGEYKVTVALNDKAAYAWADDTTDDLEYTFVIAKAAGSIAIDGNLNVTEGTEVPDVTVNAAGDGAVTVYYYTNADCTEGETTTKPTAVGNYYAKAKIAASANYEAAESNVIAFAIADSYIEMNYNKAYSYKLEGNTLNVKGADATIFVIEATYDGNKMTSCKLTPVVISGGVGSCAVSGTFFIWDANMQAMN